MVKKHKAVHKSSSKEIDDGKVCAALSYILIGIIWYFADEKMRKNNYAKFHAKQGLVFLIASIIYNIAVGIVVGGIIIPMLIRGWAFGVISIVNLLYYVPLVFFIIGLINSLNGHEKELPIIGQYAKHFNF
jgi:uncharacterized membrane protein